ncbi:putative ATP-dependent helicase Lhr [Methylobrevis pamukkalensis]|uniref:Putative ATP-dependent helicase Lhr n=1 Tax=Methylobrevis pamukkalensis TaxID=1439726 RepID=A0A1E3GYG9_9HYPH|nr:putative ATP-dependent helicase Lhr [Methylobrevis pamukkalensis]
MDRPHPVGEPVVADLPPRFAAWFAARSWSLRPHQQALLDTAAAGRSALLIAPTGAGKTLAGFLPSLVELAARGKPKPGTARRGVHTLYISPLKALAVDIARNLEAPVAEMGLPVTVETRTGDTPAHKRQRQRLNPPDILLTTPEQLALLVASSDAERIFDGLAAVVLDELHALVTSKRGDLLALGLARLRALAPAARFTGLSATVADPDQLRGWLMPQKVGGGDCSEAADAEGNGRLADLVTVPGGASPDITILASRRGCPGPAIRRAMPCRRCWRRSPATA